MTHRFSNSEVSTFKQCRRRWYLAYYRCLGVARDEDAVSTAKVGTLVHFGLELWYGAEPGERDAVYCCTEVQGRVDADIYALQQQEASIDLIGKVKKQGTLAVTMLEGYFEWIAETGADSGYEIISAEESVEVSIPGLPGVSLVGKLDARVRREQDGAILFIDHKSVQGIDAYIEALYRAPQFRHYHLLEYLRHLDGVAAGRVDPQSALRGTDGVIVNMLRRVGRTARSKPPYYERSEVRHNPHVLEAYWKQVIGEITRILETRAQLDAGADHQTLVPPNADNAQCSWKCQFKAVCPMFDDGSDVEAVISTVYVQIDPLARYADEDDTEDDGH